MTILPRDLKFKNGHEASHNDTHLAAVLFIKHHNDVSECWKFFRSTTNKFQCIEPFCQTFPSLILSQNQAQVPNRRCLPQAMMSHHNGWESEQFAHYTWSEMGLVLIDLTAVFQYRSEVFMQLWTTQCSSTQCSICTVAPTSCWINWHLVMLIAQQTRKHISSW